MSDGTNKRDEGAAIEGPARNTTSQLLVDTCKAYRKSRSEALSSLGLRTGQDQILRELWEEDGQRLSELVERLNVSFPTLTRALDRMQRDGLLVRRRDPGDARSFRVYLTDTGTALREPVERLWSDIEAWTTAGLTDEDQSSLGRLLLRIQGNLHQNEKGGRCSC